VHKAPNHITIQTPARICLFGDHQDYLGLPIIACAINMYMTFEAKKNNSESFEILMPDINIKRNIPLAENLRIAETPTDFFLAGLNVAKRYGCIPSEGYSVTITSDIPINAGISSSSALTVGWIHLLLKTFGTSEKITPEFIAQLAYESEVVEHNSPGGKMDQYTIALGNTIFLETGKKTSYQSLGSNLKGLILAESGISKETIGTLKNTRELAEKAIKIVKQHNPSFDIEKATLSKISKYDSVLDADFQPYFYAAVANHNITQKAFAEFKKERSSEKALGKLMTEHHTILKEQLKVSHPQIDSMLEAAMDAGAYGGKIVGSGGGGCAVVLASEKDTEAVITAFKKAGAIQAYSVAISNGSFLAHEA
jgi:galactokinase